MPAEVTNHLRNLDQVHHNPHMGWLLIVNCYPTTYDRGRSLAAIEDGSAWKEVDIISILSDWAACEPQDGVYDWSLMDQEILFWVAQGKTIKFRFSTDTMLTNGRLNPIGGCPEWLFALGVPHVTRQEWGLDYKVPDYTHPLYQNRMRRFIQAFADHFEQYPQIETVDLLAYGTWGEWHSGYDYANVTQRRAALTWLIDTWIGAFDGWARKPWFLLSNSYEWRNDMQPAGLSINGTPAPTYEQYITNSAFDHGFAQPRVGVGRYGVGSYVKQNYDGRYLHELYRRTRRPFYHEVAATWQQLEGGQINGYDSQSALDEALMYHPNYLTMLGWDIGAIGLPPADVPVIGFYNSESQDAMQYALKSMGYRLAIARLECPTELKAGEPFSITHEWQNHANGRLYVPYRLRFYLMNGDTVAWSDDDALFDTTSLVRGEAQEHIARFTLPADVAPGRYDLRAALVDEAGTPAITLDMAGGDADKRYLVANVEVRTDRPAPGTPVTESFESGSLAATAFVPASGTTLTNVTSETIAGTWAVKSVLGGPASETVVLRSDPSKLPLVSGATYRLSFRYRTLVAPPRDGYFAFTARSATGGNAADAGTIHWQDEAGTAPAVKTVLFTLGAQTDYALTWSIAASGGLVLDDVRLTRIADANRWYDNLAGASFAATRYRAGMSGGELVTSSAMGGNCARGQVTYDPQTLAPHWYEFLGSDPSKLTLKRNTAYTIAFRSQMKHVTPDEADLLSPAKYGQYVFFLARSAAAGPTGDVGVYQWLDQKEAYPERKLITFVTGEQDDYALLWGLRNGGSVLIDDITLIELGPVSSPQPATERLGALVDDFNATAFNTALWQYAEDGVGSMQQAGGRLSLYPATQADWLSNIITSRKTVTMHEETGLRISTVIPAVQVTSGELRIELDVRGTTTPEPYYFTAAAALTCLLVTNGTTGYVMVNSKPAGLAGNNGTVNLQGPLRMMPLNFPLRYELQVSRTGFVALLNGEVAASGTHTAAFDYEVAVALGCQNHAGGRGSVAFDLVDARPRASSGVASAACQYP